MDREINERAVISTDAQRQEVFHSNNSAATLTACVCVFIYTFYFRACKLYVALPVCDWITGKKRQQMYCSDYVRL